MKLENCAVCLVQFSPNDISLAKFTDEDNRNRDKISCVYRKILKIFCKYFNLPCKQNENENDGENQEENDIFSEFPFCIECRNLVAELCIFHEKSESIHKIIQNTVAKITMKIVQTENKKDSENFSNSDSLENQKNGQQTRNKIKHEYRRQILQNFNPRVLLTDCQSQNPNQEKFPSETNLTTANFENESLLNNGDSRGHSNDNDKDDLTQDDGRDQNYPNEEISANSSDESQEVEKCKEKNSSLNLPSIPVDKNSAGEKTKQNIMQKIRAQFNTQPQNFPTLENSTPEKKSQKKIQPSDSNQRRSKKNSLALEDKMSSPNIENLGDGKYLYKNAWPFHIIENKEVFSCDTCQRQLPFCKRRNQKFYKGIVQHIRLQHNSTADKVAKRDSAEDPGSFRFRGKWNFEKVELGFQCGHCPIIYTQFKAMQNHLEIWHVPGKFKCSKCPQSCRTRGLLNQHRCRWNLQTTNRSFEIRPGSGKFMYSGDLIG